MLLEHKTTFDDVDLFGLFKVSIARFEASTAQLTGFVFEVGDVDLFDDFKVGLVATKRSPVEFSPFMSPSTSNWRELKHFRMSKGLS